MLKSYPIPDSQSLSLVTIFEVFWWHRELTPNDLIDLDFFVIQCPSRYYTCWLSYPTSMSPNLPFEEAFQAILTISKFYPKWPHLTFVYDVIKVNKIINSVQSHVSMVRPFKWAINHLSIPFITEITDLCPIVSDLGPLCGWRVNTNTSHVTGRGWVNAGIMML